MTAYQIWLTDPNTGDFIVNLPMVLSAPYTRRLNGSGQLTGTVPMDTPGLGVVAVIEKYEITVLRDDGSGFLPDWNGPIVDMQVNARERTYDMNAQELPWLLQKRVIEVDKDYSGWDRYDVIRDLVTYATTKTSTAGDGMSTGAGSDINAAIPRLAVSPATADSGYTLDAGAVPAAQRYTVGDVFDKVVSDPDNPIDWRMDYKTGSTSTSCQRTLVLGAPLGGTVVPHVTNSDVFEVGKDLDRGRAANRVHTVGSGFTYTLQNEEDVVTNGDVLLEAVFERTDLEATTDVKAFTRAARTDSYPPVTTLPLTIATGWGALGFGFCELGDRIFYDLAGGSLTSVGYRRVVQIGVLPPTPNNPELFTVDVSVPLDSLS